MTELGASVYFKLWKTTYSDRGSVYIGYRKLLQGFESDMKYKKECSNSYDIDASETK